MAGKTDARLAELGITLEIPPGPAANYVPFVQTGDLVFVSGQIAMDATGMRKGTLGADASLEEGIAAARLCAINLIAQVQKACDGDLDRLVRVVKLNGYVASTADFFDQPRVINGASDLMVEVFGDAGRHARAAVGSSALPFGVMVEVEGVFQIE